MSLIIPANTLASGGYAVDNSLRFNSGSSDYLNKTFGSAGNRKTWTWSAWIKRSALGSSVNYLFSAGTDGNGADRRYGFYLYNDLLYQDRYGGGNALTQVFRDISAWYHIVISVDTTQATASNRTKVYINNTLYNLTTLFNQNEDTPVNSTLIHAVGGGTDNLAANHFNGYMSEVTFIDGQQLDATSFGEFDEDSGIWKPIDVSGLTFGNNGFYLDFENSGALGADVSGNSNNFTVNNLTAIDQSTDTCTNNFATLNPLNNYWSQATFSEGNSVYTSNNTTDYYGVAQSTIGVSSGKWYFEAKNSTNTDQGILGITSRNKTSRPSWLGSTTQAYGYYSTGGTIRSNSQDTSYGASYTANDIIGIYLDLDNNKMYVSDNGALQNSGTGHSITAAASTDSGFYHLAVGDNSDNTQVWQCNFGGTSGFTVSSGNTDDNGYGNFEYSPNITGDGVAKKFYALCTKNLAEYG